MKVKIVDTDEIIEFHALVRRMENKYNPVRIVQKDELVEIQQLVKVEKEIKQIVQVPIKFLGIIIWYKGVEQPIKVWKDEWHKVRTKFQDGEGNIVEKFFKTIPEAKLFVEQYKLKEIDRIEKIEDQTIHYI